MKRPRLSARTSSIKAALVAAQTAEEKPEPVLEPEEPGRIVGLSVRLDPAMHEKLMDLAHDLSKQRRKRVSQHQLIVEGLELMFSKYGR